MKHLEETIKLLTHLEQNPQVTQRDLVDKLDVSLGKVNYLVNALVARGLIKLKRFKNSKNKKGYMYLLTPKGMADKAEITKNFLTQKIEEYNRLKAEIEKLKSENSAGTAREQEAGTV